MSTATPRLCLILQNIVQTAPFTGSAIPAVATERLLTFLVDFGLWQWPIYVSTDQRPQAKLFDSLDDLVREASAWTDWVTLKSCGGLETEVELVIHDRESAVHCFVPVDTSAKDDMLSCLTALAIELWSALRDHMVVGPIFSIRPIGLDYPRPRPPRHSTLWSLGDAAYFISDEFHKNHPLGDPDAVARLIEANSPTSILREHLPGLTVIRCKGPAEDKTTFARQRYDLEVWLSSVLQLQLHPEFRDNGDQHLSVFRKESVLPFTFFDQVRGIAFKAVPNSEPCELDNETRQYLKDILRIRTLQDGRLVRQTIVVFPTREAAVHNIDVVSKLGASGVAYIGDDYCLWNPQPVGNWILTDWSKG